MAEAIDNTLLDGEPISASSSVMLSQAPNSEVAFSQMREDAGVELALAEIVAERLGRPLRVLVVGSGGCTALSLLGSDSIARIDAVDLNPAQRHLIELKRAALEALTLDEQLTFIEADENVAVEARLALYQQLRPRLPEDTRAFWDQREDQLGFGVNRVGRLEELFREVREQLTERGIDPLVNPSKALGSHDWNSIFATAFEKAKMSQTVGAASVGYSTKTQVSSHFAESFANAIRRFAGSSEDNYLLHSAFRGRYAPERGAIPPWLQPATQERAKAHGVGRLHTHTGPFLGKMLELSSDVPYDLIITSNLIDWMPGPEANRLYRAIRNSLAEGGAVLSRRLCGDHALGTMMAKHLTVDAALSSNLSGNDRSCVFREIVVGFRPANSDTLRSV